MLESDTKSYKINKVLEHEYNVEEKPLSSFPEKLIRYLIKKYSLKGKVLDVMCGRGEHAQAFYNNNLDAAKRQQALEWHDEMEIEFTGSSIPVTGLAHVKFSDKAGNPLTDLTVKILATRPTHDGFDQEFFVLHEGNGRYRVPFSLPLKGQWEFRILARRGKDDYQRVERIVTP